MKDKPKEWIRLEARIEPHQMDKLHKLAQRDTEGNLSQMIRKLVEEAK